MSYVLDAEFVKGFIRMASDGDSLGWHERNGGNLSYRIKPDEIEDIKNSLDYTHPFVPCGTTAGNLAGEYFLITGSGKYFKNIALNPEENLAIIQIDETGSRYRTVWGLVKGGVPTSELPTHLINHSVKKRISSGRIRVIYHCHPGNTIALTFVLPLDSKTFTRELWETATECPVVFPNGVGVLKWMVPGGEQIGIETGKLIEKHDIVVWAHHGIFCAGEDFDQTFGLAVTVEKAAEILVKVLSMGGKRQKITTENFKDLAKAFKLTLPNGFLE